MAEPFVVSASEHGVVRVFSAEVDGATGITADTVQTFLGEGLTLDPTRVEVFPAQDIAPIGLAAYLHEGYGVPMEQLDSAEADLNALTGLIVLVATSAFEGRAVALNPKPALRFVGLYREPASAPPVSMASPEAAEGVVAAPGRDAVPVHTRRGSTWPLVLVALLAAAALVLFLVL